MKEKIPLKYECLDGFSDKIKSCTDANLAKLLIEMYDLIVYQMNEIKEQRMEIIGFKHKHAWKHYDRPMEEYDTEKRTYVDKPEKSGNMSC
jgi:hypothetical protein